MSKVWQYVLRYGPLVAALAGGVALAYPAAAPVINSILSALGFVGVQPDPTLVPDIAALVTAGFLLLGFVRKVISKYFKPQV